MCETASCVLQRNKHDNLDLIVLLYAICLLSAAVLLFISSLWSSPKRNSIIIETTPRGEAGAQVANTFELLEGILLRLPMSEIVSAQEVNKQFKNVINNSHRLQRAVFKKPAVIPTNAASHPQPQLNPLLFLRFGNVLGNVSIKRINHFWIWKARHGLYKQEEEFIRLCTEDTVLLYLKHEGEAEDELSEESWSGMYLTQPPCDVELGVEEQEGRPPITVLKGPTMKEIVVESRRRLVKHVEPKDLPRIRQHEAAMSVYGRKQAGEDACGVEQQ